MIYYLYILKRYVPIIIIGKTGQRTDAVGKSASAVNYC